MNCRSQLHNLTGNHSLITWWQDLVRPLITCWQVKLPKQVKFLNYSQYVLKHHANNNHTNIRTCQHKCQTKLNYQLLKIHQKIKNQTQTFLSISYLKQLPEVQPSSDHQQIFDNKNENFEIFEDLFHTLLKLQLENTEAMKINPLSCSFTKRSTSKIQKHWYIKQKNPRWRAHCISTTWGQTRIKSYS